MTLLPGVETVHPRSSWEDPNLPVYDPPDYIPPRQDWSRITTGVAHYTAADDLIDGDPGEHADDLPGYIRAIQRDYRTRKGYSIGYLWAVDWLGGAWGFRGWDYRAAANLGRLAEPPETANYWTCPVLYPVDGNDPMTSEALATGRAIYREAGRRAGRPLVGPVPHGHLDPTPCPGVGIRAQIAAGLLSPNLDPTPPPPPEEDDDMQALAKPRRLVDTMIDAEGIVTVPIDEPASAVAVNITIDHPDRAGFATTNRDAGTSNVNYAAGQTVANQAIVPVIDGKIWVWSLAKARVIVDLQAVWS